MSKPSTLVGDLMTKDLITIPPTTMVKDARTKMNSMAIRHLPVVDDRERVVGMLSERDVLRAFSLDRELNVAVRKVMTEEVVVVRPHTYASEATRMLLDFGIGALPVVGNDNKLLGVVTETDFVRLAHQFLGGR